MKPDICEKISQLLLKGIETEAEAVYFLCQIRKLSEDENGKVNLPKGLAFYADWALHSILDRSSSLKIFLTDLDESIDKYFNGNSLTFKFFEDLSFDTFYEETLSFLCSKDIDKNLFDNENWFNFSKLYREVILDCPLIFNSTDSKRIKSIKLSVNENSKYPFEWNILLKNNPEGREKLRVQLIPTATGIRGWTVYLD